MPVTPIAFQGLEALHLRAPDGASAIVTLHGAHVVSWRPAARRGRPGAEQLFLSRRALFADGQPIRGGVPVVFPQFADRGSLPQHGLVRTRAWQLASAGLEGDEAVVRLLRTDDALTRAAWPHAFQAGLELRVGARSLVMRLHARNPDRQPFRFTAALHTYLRIDSLHDARVHGLEGRPYWDKVRNADLHQPRQALAIEGEVDRVYAAAPTPLRLRDGARTLELHQQGFADTVVWNPGPARCARLADMEPEGYRRMLCIEAARIGDPVTLNPGESWHGSQRLVLV